MKPLPPLSFANKAQIMTTKNADDHRTCLQERRLPGGGIIERVMLAFASGLILTGCASATLDEAGYLHSYADLRQDNGLLTKSLISVDKSRVLAARTVSIVPTAFSSRSALPFTPEQRGLVANAVDPKSLRRAERTLHGRSPCPYRQILPFTPPLPVPRQPANSRPVFQRARRWRPSCCCPRFRFPFLVFPLVWAACRSKPRLLTPWGSNWPAWSGRAAPTR